MNVQASMGVRKEFYTASVKPSCFLCQFHFKPLFNLVLRIQKFTSTHIGPCYLILILNMFSRLLILLLITLSQVYLVDAAWASDACVKSCSDWSIVLGHCRGQFEPARKSISRCWVPERSLGIEEDQDQNVEQGWVEGDAYSKTNGWQIAHQTNITYASQFIQCLCDGSKENANEMMGPGAMKEAAYTCSECITTPAVIVEDLNVSIPFPSYFHPFFQSSRFSRSWDEGRRRDR